MTVTTFKMETLSSAPVRTGSSLVPFADRWVTSWEDTEGSHTLLHVEHPDADTEELVTRVLRAHPRVEIID